MIGFTETNQRLGVTFFSPFSSLLRPLPTDALSLVSTGEHEPPALGRPVVVVVVVNAGSPFVRWPNDLIKWTQVLRNDTALDLLPARSVTFDYIARARLNL